MEAQQDAAFLGPVTANRESIWTITLRVAGKRIQFKMDTGAEVTVISEATYRKLGRISLLKATIPLRGPAGEQLEVLGQFTKKITHSKTKRASSEAIYVVRGLRNNLLGSLLLSICSSSRELIQ